MLLIGLPATQGPGAVQAEYVVRFEASRKGYREGPVQTEVHLAGAYYIESGVKKRSKNGGILLTPRVSKRRCNNR